MPDAGACIWIDTLSVLMLVGGVWLLILDTNTLHAAHVHILHSIYEDVTSAARYVDPCRHACPVPHKLPRH